jgi:hypothetical protein
LPKRPYWLHVGSPIGPVALPAAGAHVFAKTNRRFGGDTVLPAKGTINYTNKSTESPHFLVLQHVKESTTRKQVVQFAQNPQGQPTWALPGTADVDILTLNSTMNFHVNLPRGKYAEMCFFPDPKTGMDHASMGMVRMVHLK